jgi:hypothetical protein
VKLEGLAVDDSGVWKLADTYVSTVLVSYAHMYKYVVVLTGCRIWRRVRLASLPESDVLPAAIQCDLYVLNYAAADEQRDMLLRRFVS